MHSVFLNYLIYIFLYKIQTIYNHFMSRKNWNYWAIVISIFGSIQFIILTFVAMFFYKGGTYINSSTSHYIFWYNYFSDLGRYISHSGVLNIVSFVLFTTALSLWGLLQIPYYFAISKFYNKSMKLKRISIIGSILGVLAGICYIGIAFAPADLLNDLHNLFVFLGFGSIFICMILYSIVLYKDKNFTKFYVNILIISTIILGIYFVTLLLIQNIISTTRLFISAIGQKIMIYTLLVCGIIQGYGVLRQFYS